MTRFLAALTAFVVTTPLFAQEEPAGLRDLPRVGKPVDGGIGFQPAASPVMEQNIWLDNFLLIIITAITLFVTALLVYVMVRYNSAANKEPQTFTHNSAVEVTWTVVPVLILIVIGSFSLPVLFYQLEIPEEDLTIQVEGYKWGWTYKYPDEGLEFSGNMLAEDELEAYGYYPDEYLLATDTAVVVPVGAVVKVQVTGLDVIHSWAVPSFGVKADGVPGRLHETWFRADQVGVYFGQCSELCGLNHSFMPITVKVVEQDLYDEWLAFAQQEYAAAPASVQVAAAD